MSVLDTPHALITIAMLVNSHLVFSVVLADVTAESTSVVAPQESATQPDELLSLFMTQEDQQAADLRKEESTHEGQFFESVSRPDDNSVDVVSTPKLAELLDDAVAVTPIQVARRYDQPRYDGVVLRAGEVLGMWVNKKRFSPSVGLGHMQLDSVELNGQVVFSGDFHLSNYGGTAMLNPGDLLPFVLSELEPVVPVDQLAPSAEQ